MRSVVRNELNRGGVHTSIGLDSSCYFSRSNIVEKSDILSKYGLEISLTNPFRVEFASVHPNVHIHICAHKDTKTCQYSSMVDKVAAVWKFADRYKLNKMHSWLPNVENSPPLLRYCWMTRVHFVGPVKESE
jgi:hypothetical protein